MVEVSCLVVAFHRPRLVRSLLDALRDPAIEVVVVNVEEDVEVASVTRGARVVACAGNPGYAAAVNRGALAARAPVTVFMNDDLELHARTVLALARAVASGRADVVVPAIIGEDGQRQRTIQALPTPRSLLVEWALLPDSPVPALKRWLRPQKWRDPTAPTRVDAAAGTVVAVRTDLLRAEPLPEDYFLYWEDAEWFSRLARQGFRVEYDPHLQVRHEGGASEVRPEKSALMARNAIRCIHRTHGRGSAVLALPVVLLWNLRLLVADTLRLLVGPSPTSCRRARARLAGVRAAIGGWRELQ